MSAPENREAAEYAAAAPELERAANPQMDERTLTALKGSIAKWERMAADNRDDAEAAADVDCPLCVLFNKAAVRDEGDCIGCPVFEKTGRRYCTNTPYVHWADAADNGDDEWMQDAAEDELDFLRSLLPVTP